MANDMNLSDLIKAFLSQAWLARLEGNHPLAQALEKEAREASCLIETKVPSFADSYVAHLYNIFVIWEPASCSTFPTCPRI